MTPFDIAQRFVGEVREEKGDDHHPLIQWGFTLCGWDTNTPDEVPWCSAFAQIPAWLTRAPRSKSARARSWLTVGTPKPLEFAHPGWDVVILKRGVGNQPGPEVIEAPGHVGFYAGQEGNNVLILGGNQSDGVTIAPFPINRLLGVRSLYSQTVPGVPPGMGSGFGGSR